MTSITHTITRNDQEITLEIEGEFYNGDLEDYTMTPLFELTEDEDIAIIEKLYDAYFDDWNEDEYKGSKEA